MASCEIVTIAIANETIHRAIKLRSQPCIYHLRTRAITCRTDNMGVMRQVIGKILDVVLSLRKARRYGIVGDARCIEPVKHTSLHLAMAGAIRVLDNDKFTIMHNKK